MIRQILALLTVLLLAVVPVAVAQDMRVGDFDYDTDVDGTDAAVFKADFGRGGYILALLMAQSQCLRRARPRHTPLEMMVIWKEVSNGRTLGLQIMEMEQ